MMSRIGELRTRVDAICAAAKLDARVLQQLEQDPSGFLVSSGVEWTDAHDAQAHSIHMCPWHTCQATRHHETRIQ